MKKLLLSLLVLIWLVSPFAQVALARITLYGEMNKEVNGGYVAKLPSLEWNGSYGDILLENELSLLYTAPRSNMLSLNHHSVDNLFSMGVENVLVNGSFATVGLGTRYYFNGNSAGIPESWDWYNSVRLGMEF